MAPIKKLGRPKKIKEPNYKVPFKMIQEIKFEIYSLIPIGRKVVYIDDSKRKRQGVVIGATISSKTTLIKEYLINNVDQGYDCIYGPNKYVPEKYLKPKEPYYARRLKDGKIVRIPIKKIETCRVKH